MILYLLLACGSDEGTTLALTVTRDEHVTSYEVGDTFILLLAFVIGSFAGSAGVRVLRKEK